MPPLPSRMLQWLMPAAEGIQNEAPAQHGVRAFRREYGGRLVRLHLRVDPDGYGLLLVDAASAIHLEPTGCLMALAMLEGDPDDAVVRRVMDTFGSVTHDQVVADLERMDKLLDVLAAPQDGQFPWATLGAVSVDVRQRSLAAPLMAHLVPGDPKPTLAFLDKLWGAGIPVVEVHDHGERPGELLAAVEHAEKLGMVTLVRSEAKRLRDDELIEDLTAAGLDCLVLPMASTRVDLHDAVYGQGTFVATRMMAEAADRRGIAAMVELPLLEYAREDLEQLGQLREDLALEGVAVWPLVDPDLLATSSLEMTVPSDSLSSISIDQEDTVTASSVTDPLPLTPHGMLSVAREVEQMAASVPWPLQWLPPVRRDPAVPLREQLARGPRGAGDVAVVVQPDGSVGPVRGPRRAVGSLETQDFDEVWAHEAFTHIREPTDEVRRCESCPGLSLCAEACQLDPVSWIDDRES